MLALDSIPSTFRAPGRVRTPAQIPGGSLLLPAGAGTRDLALKGRPGLLRHALGTAPSRAGGGGSGRGPELVGTAPPSLSPTVARGDEEASSAVCHRGQ